MQKADDDQDQDQRQDPNRDQNRNRGQDRTLEHPIRHTKVGAGKTVVHGWYFPFSSGKRECSSERILVNPYNGCSVNCPFCYTRAYRGHFADWNRNGTVTVFEGIDRKLSEELSQLYCASCGYLSPVTEPFQHPLEQEYHLSERCIDAFLDLDLPVEFVTKAGSRVPVRLLDRMAEHRYGDCFCQFSVLSLDDSVRACFSPGGSTPDEQLAAAGRSAERGLYTVVRVDPILPGITDGASDLEALVEASKLSGCRHIIASVCDVSVRNMGAILRTVESFSPGAGRLWRKVYTERIGASYHAEEGYRRRVFTLLKGLCGKQGLTFALCMEFSSPPGCSGMNRHYMTSRVCEGKEVPLYRRASLREKFKPVGGCDGDCLSCARGTRVAVCGEPAMMEARGMRYSDYKKMRP